MELNRPLRIAVRPCQLSEPTLPCLNDWASTPKKQVVRQLLEDRGFDPLEAYGIWGFTELAPLGQEWGKLQLGDMLLFYAKKTFFARSYVIALTQDADLAHTQWPKGGREYPCLMVYTKPSPFRLKLDRFNDIVGFKPAFRPQGFRVLSEEQSALVRAACDLGDVPDKYRAMRLERAMPSVDGLEGAGVHLAAR